MTTFTMNEDSNVRTTAADAHGFPTGGTAGATRAPGPGPYPTIGVFAESGVISMSTTPRASDFER